MLSKAREGLSKSGKASAEQNVWQRRLVVAWPLLVQPPQKRFQAVIKSALAQPAQRPKSGNPTEPSRPHRPHAELSSVGSPGFLDFGLWRGCAGICFDCDLENLVGRLR